ncbi:MAG: NADH-quinone oxidoreductase subunit NuoN [bacterium]
MDNTIFDSLHLATPELLLLCAAFVVLLLDVFLAKSFRLITYLVTMISLATTAWLLFNEFGTVKEAEAFGGLYIRDPLADLLKLSMALITMAVFAYSRAYLRDRQMYIGEYYSLGLFALLGMMIMVSANNMLSIYLGLELLALASYAMVAMQRDNSRASEAAMKYFVLGAVASGMLLYGMSLIYGLTTTLEIAEITEKLASEKDVNSQIGLLLGLSFILIGLGFKLGVAPFHMWIPDVYQGAPTAVTQFISAAPKIATFGMVFRLLGEGLGEMHESWQQIMILFVILSLALGNIIAIAQTNLKRMLAYSTIAHMGFIALGILAGGEAGFSAALFYVIAYAFMSMGGFGLLILLSHKGFKAESLNDIKGLSHTHPWYALMFMLILFSMAGVPPTLGFYAKLSVLQAVLTENAALTWLAIYAVVLSVVGAFYYLRAVKVMYFDEPEQRIKGESADDRPSIEANVIFSLNGLGVIALGIFPSALMMACVIAVKQSL